MSGPGSVTVWLDRLKTGQDRDDAVAGLWARYFHKLVYQARGHLRGRRARADEEDAALSAFDRFVKGMEAGKFPKLDDRDDLWRLLLMMTGNKAKNVIRDANRDKRGGGLAAHGIASADSDPDGVQVLSDEPDPAEAVILAEEIEQLLRKLGDAELRRIAEWAMAGHTNAEIATEIGKSMATVERKLKRIREIWGSMGYG